MLFLWYCSVEGSPNSLASRLCGVTYNNIVKAAVQSYDQIIIRLIVALVAGNFSNFNRLWG